MILKLVKTFSHGYFFIAIFKDSESLFFRYSKLWMLNICELHFIPPSLSLSLSLSLPLSLHFVRIEVKLIVFPVPIFFHDLNWAIFFPTNKLLENISHVLFHIRF